MLVHCMHIRTNTGGMSTYTDFLTPTDQSLSHQPLLSSTHLLPPPSLTYHHHSGPPTSLSAPHPPLNPIPQVLPLTHHSSLPRLTQPFPPLPCWPLCCLALVHPCSASWWSGCCGIVHGSPPHLHPHSHLPPLSFARRSLPLCCYYCTIAKDRGWHVRLPICTLIPSHH